jgi:hypothetical protein
MSVRSKSKKSRATVNRANAQKSSGPKTEQGKAVSSQNSFKHGLYSKAIVIPGEDPAKFEALRADLGAEHRPVGVTEEMLVDELAQHYWRMKRFRSLDAQMYRSKGPQENGGSALDTASLVQCIDLGLFTSIQRALNSAERSFYKALNTLRELQKARGFVPAQAGAVASAAAASSSLPTPFPVKQRSAAQQRAEIQAATGMNEAQLMNFFRGAA